MYKHPQYSRRYGPKEYIDKQEQIHKAFTQKAKTMDEFIEKIKESLADEKGHSADHEKSLPGAIDHMLKKKSKCMVCSMTPKQNGKLLHKQSLIMKNRLPTGYTIQKLRQSKASILK